MSSVRAGSTGRYRSMETGPKIVSNMSSVENATPAVFLDLSECCIVLLSIANMVVCHA
jgi:hypothetical protein